MSRFLRVAITAMAAVSMWACVDNSNANKPANTNANSNANATASKPAATADALMAMDKQAQEAYLKNDGAFFQTFLGDKFMMYEDNGKIATKAELVKSVGEGKCEAKSSSFEEQKATMLDADTALLTYKATVDGSCGGHKIPSPTRAASVYIRMGEKWTPVWHGETAIVAMPAKTADTKADEKADRPEPPKVVSASPANSNSSAMANSNSNSAASSADPNVDAMIAVEKSGWEAWKARDAAKLNEFSAANVSYIDLFGNYAQTKADVVKSWTGSNCTITSTSVTDAKGMTISPTMGMIMFKGTGVGECEGMKIKPIYGTSFYVKEGSAWKLVFGFENPAA